MAVGPADGRLKPRARAVRVVALDVSGLDECAVQAELSAYVDVLQPGAQGR